MGVQKTQVNSSDVENNFQREKSSSKAKSSIQWTKVDYLWALLGLIGVIIVVKGVFVLEDARVMMTDSTRYEPEAFGVKTAEQLKALFAAYQWPSISYFWMPLSVAIACGILEKGIMRCGMNWARNIQTDESKDDQPEEKIDKKAKKILENQIESIYYLITFVLGAILLQQSDFLPWYLGGMSKDQGLENLYANYPLIAHPKYMSSFFFANLGLHLLRTFQLVTTPVEKRKKDFLEMLLHHGVTLVLFTGAFVINYVSVGMLVVYALDFNNIWVHQCKSLGGTKLEGLVNFFGVLMWISWLYCRLIAMPIFIYEACFTQFYKIKPSLAGSPIETIDWILATFCAFIFFLSIFWFYLITRIIYRSFAHGDQTDDQEDS